MPVEMEALTELKRLLAAQVHPIELRLFGSKARGDAEPDADLDVMIEIEEMSPSVTGRVYNLVYEVNLRFGVLISPLLFGREELEHGPMAASPVYKAIQREGVRL
jgi:predicted nucleotidyltransferase